MSTRTPASGHEALTRFAPTAAHLVQHLAATVPTFADLPLTAWARHATAGVTGLRPLPGARACDTSAAAATAFELAEQVALDVSSFDDSQRVRATELVGRSAHTWLLTVYLADWVPRLRHAVDLAFGDSTWAADQPDGHDDVRRLWPDFVALTEAIGALRGLDPVISEVVRLRMARQHQCELCQSLRNRTALEAGGREEMYAEVDRWETSDAFDERTRAALALTDAMIWNPSGAAAPVAEMVARFSPAEVVELLLDMLRNAANKVAVASGTDAAHVTEGVEIYDVLASGETVFGLPHPG